jgi:hypothetical protein
MNTEDFRAVTLKKVSNKTEGTYNNPIPIKISVDGECPVEDRSPEAVREGKGTPVIPKRSKKNRNLNKVRRGFSSMENERQAAETEERGQWEQIMDAVAFPEQSIPILLSPFTEKWTQEETRNALSITFHDTLLCGE